MNKEQFINGCKENNIKIIERPAKWPYNYGDNKDLYATNSNGVTMRFFFNDDGILLSKEVIK